MESRPMKMYKFTGPQGEPLVAKSTARWPLPHDDKPGRWTREREDPALCVRGWHLCTLCGLSQHVQVGILWEAEGRGQSMGDDSKIAFASARLVRKVGEITSPILVRAACDWAEHVQPDPVPGASALAVALARAWADCPCEEHRLAAYAAAGAARHAANAANTANNAYAAYAAHAARHAANAAAERTADEATAYAVAAAAYAAYAAHAAAYAARAAERTAANAAEREWQGRRLLELLGTEHSEVWGFI